ncbi:hypothetical protein S40285_02810 [Stachybotrys chlorohalonatus IBT 40285]|uniref:Uncharacterized protein n=1 Tax=Stachybotrys chlorohalonatus (strain IBT 40285) TaxID=1283841 RepID=A0A084QDB8_STAC4|nr:hypothetical protein S40285_02810 [Stachybotrys chlorohalonata IBT 40285]
MDAGEGDVDVKLQRVSADLIAEFDQTLPSFLRKPDGRGGFRVRSRVRISESKRLTSSLLDPYLPKWVPLLSAAYLEALQTRRRSGRGASSSSSAWLVSVDNAVCDILYTLCKIRGEKVIVRFLNVETKYLELLLSAIEGAEQPILEGADASLQWSWQQRYIVLLWLSHLLLAPFDLATISSVDLEDISVADIPGLEWPQNLPGITLRVVPLAIKYIATSGKERDAAKILLVRLSMRRDMQQLGVLDSLVKWALTSLHLQPSEASQSSYFYLGVLSYLAGALRSSADTTDMNKHLTSIFQTVYTISTEKTQGSGAIMTLALARKMILKVLRSIIVSLLGQKRQDMESTELTETTIGYLLESLADNDTPVRFAASKSLAIITLKLDSDMAAQVVEAVLESLNRNVLWRKPGDSHPVRDLSAVNSLEWHGLMLTLSHLLYRHSPPPEQLSDIIHALLLGLSFEQRGISGGSVGTNVRDAACFGIWALARRYNTNELLEIPTHSVFAAKAHSASSSILQVLGTELVTTASLDPVGNIRRGASAALQELIGRHPDTVDKGIEIVQAVDYHAVARRSRAIQEVAMSATKLSRQYGEAVMDAILGWRGIGDPDTPSRRIAASAFGKLTAEMIKFNTNAPSRGLEAAFSLVVKQLEGLQTRQVEERHGLLLCLSAVIDEIPGLAHATRQHKHAGTASASSIAHRVLPVVAAVLEELRSAKFRKPELVAEAAGQLAVSALPLLQVVALPETPLENLEPGHMTVSPARTEEYTRLVLTLDSIVSIRKDVQSFTFALKDVLSGWLVRNEPETIDPVYKSALVLLMFSNPEERSRLLDDWIQLIRHKPKSRTAVHGNGYFYILANAQPLTGGRKSVSGGVDAVSDAFLERWNADSEVETRVAILQSLVRSRLLQAEPLTFLGLLADGLNDYTTNARGDVGSHVRVEALRAVKRVWGDSTREPGGSIYLTRSVQALFHSTLRLSAEKLDRVRPEAQAALALLMQDKYADSIESHSTQNANRGIRHSQAFRQLTFSSVAYFRTLLMLSSSECFLPEVAQLAEANTQDWMSALMAGYVTSADTGNDDLVVASRAALSEVCSTSQDQIDLVWTSLYHNLKAHQGQDRILVPTLEIVAYLFHAGLMPRGQGLNYRQLCLQVQKAGYKTGNLRKLLACVKVYGGVATMLTGQDGAAKEARKRLGALLLHPWPRVRSAVVDQLWCLLGNGEGSPGDALMGVDWAKADKAQVKAVMEELHLG